jgi:hypothetical protein
MAKSNPAEGATTSFLDQDKGSRTVKVNGFPSTFNHLSKVCFPKMASPKGICSTITTKSPNSIQRLRETGDLFHGVSGEGIDLAATIRRVQTVFKK